MKKATMETAYGKVRGTTRKPSRWKTRPRKRLSSLPLRLPGTFFGLRVKLTKRSRSRALKGKGKKRLPRLPRSWPSSARLPV